MSLRMQPTARRAANVLAKQGIHLASKPDVGLPEMPRDITHLDDEELMGLFTELVAWTDYATTQLAAAQIDERAAEKKVAVLTNTLLAKATPGRTGDRITVLKAAIASDAAVLDLDAEVEDLYAYRKLVESLAGNLERDAALVSRELTRRTSTTPVAQRNKRYST